ncbi:hypothetical protein [Burkholderia cepacia]|uniref:hypothetical protein n=1 Tax=Burkholderia cepacia TaxID=292 RepID=UPI001CF1EF8E|nr:hypothetical protein [Burkholderia cepacia]MCA8354207.1 hypothetical protein [Burkholderia cepacia]
MKDFALGAAGVPNGTLNNMVGLIVNDIIDSEPSPSETSSNTNHQAPAVNISMQATTQHQEPIHLNQDKQYLDGAISAFVCLSVFLALGACCVKDKLAQRADIKKNKTNLKF